MNYSMHKDDILRFNSNLRELLSEGRKILKLFMGILIIVY